MKEKKIEPKITLTVYVLVNTICYIVKDNNTILKIQTQDYLINSNSLYNIRKQLITNVKNIIQDFNPDTIILEQTKLFTDGITKYPDPEVYKNIMLKYSIQTTLEDHFLELVKYFLVIPYWQWTQTILNSKIKYIFDRCKNHIILDTTIDKNYLNMIDNLNLFQALCFSECVKHNELMNKKYLIR